MPIPPARFDGMPAWKQHAMEFEQALLQMSHIRDHVVPAGRTAADIVDDAWKMTPVCNSTEDAIKKYADQMLEIAQSFHDKVHVGLTTTIYLQNANDPKNSLRCHIGFFDKLQVAIDEYTKINPHPPVLELQYSGAPFADRRVYGYNTPSGLNMKDGGKIFVYHESFEVDAAAPPATNQGYELCIHGAEDLRDVLCASYTWRMGMQFKTFVGDFCRCKGLHADKVRFLYGGQEMQNHYTLREMNFDTYIEYKRGPGPKIIYVLPKPEYESEPDECFVPGACEDEEEESAGAGVQTRESRRRRPVVKMSL